jgi:hypothetical protein
LHHHEQRVLLLIISHENGWTPRKYHFREFQGRSSYKKFVSIRENSWLKKPSCFFVYLRSRKIFDHPNRAGLPVPEYANAYSYGYVMDARNPVEDLPLQKIRG